MIGSQFASFELHFKLLQEKKRLVSSLYTCFICKMMSAPGTDMHFMIKPKTVMIIYLKPSVVMSLIILKNHNQQMR